MKFGTPVYAMVLVSKIAFILCASNFSSSINQYKEIKKDLIFLPCRYAYL